MVSRLQKCNQDIYKAYQIIDSVMSVLKGFRENIDLEFNNSSNFVLKLAEEVGRTPPVPKLAKCWSRFRPNVDNDSS